MAPRQSPNSIRKTFLALPAFDGKQAYVDEGRYRRQGQTNWHRWSLPALQQQYFLQVGVLGEPDESGRFPCHVALRVPTPTNPLSEFEDLDLELSVDDFQEPMRLTPDKRLMFSPDENQIITIPKTNDHLTLRRLDVDELLKESQQDSLFFTSPAPFVLVAQKPFQYQFLAKSSRGDVQYTHQLHKNAELVLKKSGERPCFSV